MHTDQPVMKLVDEKKWRDFNFIVCLLGVNRVQKTTSRKLVHPSVVLVMK